MSGIPTQEDINVYVNCMEEIKLRDQAIEDFFRVANKTLCNISCAEFVSVQIRKMLELIALASLASHKDEFAKQHQKFAEAWRAKKILKDLEKLNPAFYPAPSVQIRDPQTGTVLELGKMSEPYLTKQDFDYVYQKCSEVLHAQNPYGQQENLLKILAEFPIWTRKIRNLLNHHQVQLLNAEHQLWVVMKAEKDGRVHAALMQKIEDSAKIKLLNERRIKAGLLDEKEMTNSVAPIPA